MNTGIGDAVNLAWKLAAVLNGGAADQPARHLRAGAHRLCPAAGRHHRSRVHPGDDAGASSPGLCVLGSFRCSRPRCFDLPPLRRFLFRTVSQIGDQLSPQPAERGRGRGRPGRGSVAVGRDRAGTRQLRSARLAGVAGPRVRRTATRRGRSLRRTSASAPPLRVAAGNAASRPEECGALSHPARRLRRPCRFAGRS